MRRDFVAFVLGLLHQLFLFALDTVFLILYRNKGHQDESLRQKVLIVRLDAIGDFFLWLGVVRALQEIYPRKQYELTLLGNALWAPLAEDIGVFDAVWPLDKKSFFDSPLYRLRIMKKVRRASFDVVAQPVFSREFSYGDSLVRVTGAPERIGFQGDTSNLSAYAKMVSDRWYTKLLTVDAEKVMELQRQTEFMRGLGFVGFESSFPSLDVCYALPSEFTHEKYYVVVPGAGAQHRQWPLENFANIAKLVYDYSGLTAVICGVNSEAILGDRLVDFQSMLFQNWAGKTSLQELVAIIGGAEFVLGNETSTVHIAAAMKVPSVCIQGGGHFGRFLPYKVDDESVGQLPLSVNVPMDCFNCNWECRFKVPKGHPVPCVERVEVESVWGAIEQVLQRQE